MAFRSVQPQQEAEVNLFEDVKPAKVSLPKRFSIDFDPTTGLKLAGAFALVCFGALTSGSYFLVTSRFKGMLATLFYEWQIGTIIIMAGMILLYHFWVNRE